MTTPTEKPPPSALDISVLAVRLLEDNPLFNSGHGAVFTRDGVNELEASVAVSRGKRKRVVGVSGLRRVRNPVVLAREVLQRGDDDLEPRVVHQGEEDGENGRLDVPSAQGHTLLFGQVAEQLAEEYGLDMVDPGYFFTQRRWDEHQRGLERERHGATASWSAEEYIPQGTCGAVAVDASGAVCAATSTGGLTNKLTGRVGDTPVPGAGYWAEEWTEEESSDSSTDSAWHQLRQDITAAGPSISLRGALAGLLADCLPSPSLYNPVPNPRLVTTRSFAGSGTGNGDSFLRTAALRTVASTARWKPESCATAVTRVAGQDGELQRSAGDRWGRTGEGEGGIIGVECVVVRDELGRVVEARSDVLMDFNCGGMFRAWVDDAGKPVFSVWTNGSEDQL